MITKKIIIIIGIVLMITYNVLGLEYLLYSIFKNGNTKVFYLFLLLFLTVEVLMIDVLNRLGWFGRLTNSLIVLISIFLGLGTLKILLAFLE